MQANHPSPLFRIKVTAGFAKDTGYQQGVFQLLGNEQTLVLDGFDMTMDPASGLGMPVGSYILGLSHVSVRGEDLLGYQERPPTSLSHKECFAAWYQADSGSRRL